MGIPADLRDAWINRRKSILIASPAEEQKILRSKRCTEEGVRAGAKAAAVACVVSAVPTLVAVRVIPWAKANLNYTAQTLIISAGTVMAQFGPNTLERMHVGSRLIMQKLLVETQISSIAAYFITADKTILECARRNSIAELEKTA